MGMQVGAAYTLPQKAVVDPGLPLLCRMVEAVGHRGSTVLLGTIPVLLRVPHMGYDRQAAAVARVPRLGRPPQAVSEQGVLQG